jgi:hypothetical protein
MAPAKQSMAPTRNAIHQFPVGDGANAKLLVMLEEDAGGKLGRRDG